MKAKFFRGPEEFRKWLEPNHASVEELWVGYYKKSSGRPSLTWPESVDEALCFGWIDGIRKSLDAVSYTIRFTPRRSGIWSAVNIRRVKVLKELEKMRPAGIKAFQARKENRSGIYSYEQRPVSLVEPYLALLRKNKAAWKYFEAQPPSYKKVATWWVISAKQEETRLRRLQKLAEDSARGRRIRQFTRRTPSNQG